MTGRTWELSYPSRPLTLNAERKGNRHQRSESMRLWRQAFWALALEAKVARCQRVRLTVRAHLRGRQAVDIDSCSPSIKAAIDGLVDARVIPDDGHGFIEHLLILEPAIRAERDLFTITIEEVTNA